MGATTLWLHIIKIWVLKEIVVDMVHNFLRWKALLHQVENACFGNRRGCTRHEEFGICCGWCWGVIVDRKCYVRIVGKSSDYSDSFRARKIREKCIFFYNSLYPYRHNHILHFIPYKYPMKCN